jgi:hypothetical protein
MSILAVWVANAGSAQVPTDDEPFAEQTEAFQNEEDSDEREVKPPPRRENDLQRLNPSIGIPPGDDSDAEAADNGERTFDFRRPDNRGRIGNSSGGPSISVRRGVTRITASEGKWNIRIVDQPGNIRVELTRVYGPAEFSQLRQRFPELANHIDALDAFPTEIDSEEIRLNVEVKSVYSADSATDLAEKDLAAHNLYQKYMRMTLRPDDKAIPSQNRPTGKNRTGPGIDK